MPPFQQDFSLSQDPPNWLLIHERGWFSLVYQGFLQHPRYVCSLFLINSLLSEILWTFISHPQSDPDTLHSTQLSEQTGLDSHHARNAPNIPRYSKIFLIGYSMCHYLVSSRSSTPYCLTSSLLWFRKIFPLDPSSHI